ncbi:peptide-N(4)-(N-acetyl-beta-glucosaminyl)asparagine amidase [Diaphorina citri]|uniref:Peptide-N(4)-(N-acetyl-beta-glucosaminyl)asparagine amidase n=1 Tax=Diaphorina citri TaxID=121845 RepID=A0A1S3DJM0_DIACI|nr:peptide-N(4)-(N-acetyl-beta-glucosaminyl)asparagine amidase [Diaphorina citri]
MSPHNDILADLYSLSSKVLQYEDKALQEKAKQLIPIDKITVQSEQQLRQIQYGIKKKELDPEHETYVQEIFVLHLMRWFKEEFFSWVDNLDCQLCAGPTERIASISHHPTSKERIETFHCSRCNIDTLFQRFNSVSDLLESRRGRCGEWANCFTFLCRALGYRVRLVHDATDHAWTEIYSPIQKRWIHCDPCEAKMDSPLLYERGWNKKLTYVLAASVEEVQDVTWRYTADYKGTLQRRNKVSEADLMNAILSINKTRQSSLSPNRRQYLTHCLISELVEFLTPPSVPEGEMGGRTSGSLEWRLDRGETSGDQPGFTFQLRDDDFVQNTFCLEYSPVTDGYFKNRHTTNFTSNEPPLITTWSSGVYSTQNVFRKVERDWKMVYLCRTEKSTAGSIKWKLDFSALTKPVASVEVKVSTLPSRHIYSPIQKRWIHCDPCEAKMDSPLLYERGWNKKLTYVLAASVEEVQVRIDSQVDGNQ